ncbi:DUF2309 domain-containing protein [Leeuwenhoekiella parthenopeia]|uniref:Probable inorganic carbon transporter subunit DabA n=1 Tax=Leeuwenhoekiella parthenopeia TaxID=2890320 RepID=A0ABS8GQS0_9FLAO|nr:DUF2309 domain-containing protein [Leeuwenhoekiella parthenopeia]MCC4212050.1 DUF2309 domain-containing protein [Leeuwenhoekiella parthenopeia]
MNPQLAHTITKAARTVGNTWPLYTFVASNPLTGYEDMSFRKAGLLAGEYRSAQAFPGVKALRKAWENGAIDAKLLKAALKKEGFTETPDHYLNFLEAQKPEISANAHQELDRVMVKWLAAFLDEGLAEWSMPFKTEGFYTAWRYLAIYDTEIGRVSLKDIPKTPEKTLENLLQEYSPEEQEEIFTRHLAALPGWTGYIRQRVQAATDWQQEYPISLEEYLAVRLWTCDRLNLPFFVDIARQKEESEAQQLQYLWLKAWEESWQKNLLSKLEKSGISAERKEANTRPDAQLVFCIDTRSEAIRRNIEAQGNYETFGYAGFFGIAMDYESTRDGITRKACPPIVESAYTVTEKPREEEQAAFKKYAQKNRLKNFKDYAFKRMKNMLPSAFGFVEGSGVFYGIALMGRTLFPASIYKGKEQRANDLESCCEPDMHKNAHGDEPVLNISLAEKTAIVKGAFDLMGWKTFAPVVVFAGHGSHSANNPFSSSLDCGACAASPGRHNARMLAALANLPEVQRQLKEQHGIEIPQDTLFVGAEHNTTTNAIVLFDSAFTKARQAQLESLKASLKKAQQTANAESFQTAGNTNLKAFKKANNWSETRPEWGLSKNAGFIVGPRALTQNMDLDGQCFLHSYDWKTDTEGKALEAIMKGPMTVTQWINNHYYFSAVDNEQYGGGSKITHNITGKFGVVQGNGGDLKVGLPLQSLFSSDDELYHLPLRLSVVIQAPVSRVSQILIDNPQLKSLLDNKWIHLLVIDPQQNEEVFRYAKGLDWKTVEKSFSAKSSKPEQAVMA